MKIVHLDKSNFDSFISNEPLPVVVDFWADWCGPCKMIAPFLEEIALREDLRVVKVDVDKSSGLAERYGVRGIPTILLFKNNEIIATRVGAGSKSVIESWINSNI